MAVRPIDGTWSKFVWNLSKSESLARKFRDGKACLIDLRLAVEAQPTLTPPNDPLTLDELREMDGEPVYIPEIECWALVKREQTTLLFTFSDGRQCPASEWYEQVGPVYRRLPEGDV